MNNTSKKIVQLCDTVPAKIFQYSEEELVQKPAPDKWSKKELLGHLIDSAANNHQRFVRAQLEDKPIIYYDQDNWVSVQQYQLADTSQMVSLWETYNRHLAHVINQIPEQDFARTSTGRNGSEYTLGYLVEDYLSHLEHHLKQLLF